MNLATLYVSLKADTAGFASGLTGAIGSVGSSLGRLGGMAASAAAMLGVGVGTGLGAALAGVGVKAVRMSADMEQTKIGFTTLLGSAQKSEAFLKQLYDFAEKTPFEVTGLLESSKRLLAYGFAAEKVIPMLTAVGNATSALGMGAEGINRVTLAIGQMSAKGKVSAEEMRQLAEAGIPAWAMIAEKIGVDIPTAMKMAEKGAIDAKTGMDALIDGMEKKFGGLMEKQSGTVLGIVSNIKDALSRTMLPLGDAIVKALDLKERLKGTLEWLTGLRERIEKAGIREALNYIFGKELVDSLAKLGASVAGFGRSVGTLAREWGKAFAPVMPDGPILPQVISFAAGVVDAVTKVTTFLANMGNYIQVGIFSAIALFYQMRAAAGEMATDIMARFLGVAVALDSLPWVDLGDAIGAIGAKIADVGAQSQKDAATFEFWQSAAAAAARRVAEVEAATKGVADAVTKTVPAAAQDVQKPLEDVFKQFGQSIGDQWAGGFGQGVEAGTTYAAQVMEKRKAEMEGREWKLKISIDEMALATALTRLGFDVPGMHSGAQPA